MIQKSSTAIDLVILKNILVESKLLDKKKIDELVKLAKEHNDKIGKEIKNGK